MSDPSNGYESIAELYITVRGSTSDGIGAGVVRAWARTFKKGSVVLDAGCGTGLPVTKMLLGEGLNVFAVDASPSMVQAFRNHFPDVPVACEPAESSAFFGRRFDGIIAVGLVFLLAEDTQETLLTRMAAALEPGGKLLFTAPRQQTEWEDVLTGRLSRSLGAEKYRSILTSAGLELREEFDDEGMNHYYHAVRVRQG